MKASAGACELLGQTVSSHVPFRSFNFLLLSHVADNGRILVLLIQVCQKSMVSNGIIRCRCLMYYNCNYIIKKRLVLNTEFLKTKNKKYSLFF